jgi:hypothetical protein
VPALLVPLVLVLLFPPVPALLVPLLLVLLFPPVPALLVPLLLELLGPAAPEPVPPEPPVSNWRPPRPSIARQPAAAVTPRSAT